MMWILMDKWLLKLPFASIARGVKNQALRSVVVIRCIGVRFGQVRQQEPRYNTEAEFSPEYHS